MSGEENKRHGVESFDMARYAPRTFPRYSGYGQRGNGRRVDNRPVCRRKDCREPLGLMQQLGVVPPLA